MNAPSPTTRLPFHEWKANFRRAEAPLVRAREDYYVLYGRYCEKRKAIDKAREPSTPSPAPKE